MQCGLGEHNLYGLGEIDSVKNIQLRYVDQLNCNIFAWPLGFFPLVFFPYVSCIGDIL